MPFRQDGKEIYGDDQLMTNVISIAFINNPPLQTREILGARQGRLALFVTAGSLAPISATSPMIHIGGRPGEGFPIKLEQVDPNKDDMHQLFRREEYRSMIDGPVWGQQRGIDGILVTLTEVWCTCEGPMY